MCLRNGLAAVLILVLNFCLTPSVGADDTDANRQLSKLEKATAELQTVADDFRLKQAEMAWLLSTAQRQEAKALTGITADTRTLAFMLGPTDPDAVKRSTGRTVGLTTELQNALVAFNEEVAQARRFQDEICDNAELLKSDPPPLASRISDWIDQATRMLKSSTTGLREKRAALTSAWHALSQTAGDLAIHLGGLESMLSHSQEYQTVYKRLIGYRTALEAAGKNLAKARKLRKELAEVQASFPTTERFLRGRLQRLRMLTPASAGLMPRIDAALTKLKEMVPPSVLPEVGQLSERSRQLLKSMANINPTELAANLERAKSTAKAARPVLEKARDALHQASSSQAGFDGLGRGRRCAAALRQAISGSGTGLDPDRSLIEELQTRLEQAERREHLFTVRNQKSRQLLKRAKMLADEAETIVRTWVAAPELLAERLGDVKTAPVINNLETLLPALDQSATSLQKTGAILTKAAQDAKRQKTETCGQAEQTDASPPPAAAQVKAWRQESLNKIQTIRGQAAAAQKIARTQASELGRLTKASAMAKDQLTTAKDGLVIWLRTQAKIHVQAVRMQDLWKEALVEGAKSDREREELLRLKKVAVEDVSEIQKIAADLITRLADDASAAELEYIRTRAAALVARYQRARIVEKFKTPDFSPKFLDQLIKTLSDVVSRTEREIGQAMRVIKRADASLKQAKAVRLAAANAYSEASRLLIDAELCADILAKTPAPSTSEDGEAKVRQALTACDYPGATTLINALPQGVTKDELLKQLTDQQARDREARSGLAQAQNLFDVCQHDQALRSLAAAQQKAACPDDLRAIADLRAKVEAAKPVDAQAATLITQAEDKFEACELQASLNLLLKAQGMAKCGKYKEEIKKSIALGRGAQAAEPQYQLLLGQAIAKYQDCRLTDALQLLEQAKPFAKCRKYKRRVARMIRKATEKKAYEQKTVQMFQAGKKLYLDGEYAKARDMFSQAREYTTCDRFKDSLKNWIDKANAQIGDDSTPPDSGQDQPPSNQCTELVRQMEAESGKIHETWRQWGALKRAGQPKSVTRPAACRVAAAIKRFRVLRKKAQSAHCQHAVTFSRPQGEPSWPIGVCGSQQNGDDSNSHEANCQADKDKKTRLEAEEKRLIEKYKQMKRNRVSDAQMKPVACAIVKKYGEISRLLKDAINRGCNVGGHSIWGLEKYKRLCGSGRGTENPSRNCDRHYGQLRSLAQANGRIVVQMQRLAGRADSQGAAKAMACQMVGNLNRMNKIFEEARNDGCQVTNQVQPQQLQYFSSICSGR